MINQRWTSWFSPSEHAQGASTYVEKQSLTSGSTRKPPLTSSPLLVFTVMTKLSLSIFIRPAFLLFLLMAYTQGCCEHPLPVFYWTWSVFPWVPDKEGKSWVSEPFTLRSVLGWHSLLHPLLLSLPVAEAFTEHQRIRLWSFLNSNILNEQQELCRFPISYAFVTFGMGP